MDSGAASGYIIELRLQGTKVVLLGGGRVARRKLEPLLKAGAAVELIDPHPLTALPRHSRLRHLQRQFQPTDLDGARLAFAASDDPCANERFAAAAAERNIPCCRTDLGEQSDFSVPARLDRPPLCISVSTGGTSPAMASVLRDRLAEMIPPAWQTATLLLGAVRRKLLTTKPPITYNQQVLLQLVERGLLERIEQADSDAINRLLQESFGDGFSLENLSFTLPEGTP